MCSIKGDKKLTTFIPIQLPILLTRRRFRLVGKATIDPSTNNCNNTNYVLDDKNWFMPMLKPSPKLYCFVQIFVDIFPCPKHDFFYEVDLGFVKDEIMEFRLNYHKFGLMRCCTFYIHVELQPSTWSEHSGERWDPKHYVDKNWIMNNRQFHIPGNPTKLFFWLEFIEEMQLFAIKDEAVTTCADTNPYLLWFPKECIRYLRTFSFVGSCTIRTRYKDDKERPNSLPQIIRYDSRTHSREMIENLRLICWNNPVAFLGNIKTRKMIIRNVERIEWKETKNEVELIFLRTLFPNSTLVGFLTQAMLVPHIAGFEVRYSINPTVLSDEKDSLHFITCAPISSPAFLSLIGWLTGGWVLAGMFLAYNYQGSNIDQLTSPLIPTHMETFTEIFSNNLTIFSMPNNHSWFQRKQDRLDTMKRYEYDIRPWWNSDELTVSQLYLRNNFNETEGLVKERLKNITKHPKNQMESRALLKFDYYVNQIAKCGQDVFVDKLVEVNRLHFALAKRLGYNEKDIATSKETYVGNGYVVEKLEISVTFLEGYCSIRQDFWWHVLYRSCMNVEKV
ncbi:unnamed protein product [Orchesella dallaii]|uniref:Uncharacterized protein n=1 Tax=Orchesella dallaii TaxID=48710 RepID=A0ABP1RQ80_9HEXA